MDHRHQGQASKSMKENNYNSKKESSRELRKNNQNALKVKYISSPMRVKTSASQFRSLVQQLTGKNSDIERCMAEADHHAGNDGFHEIGDHGAVAAYNETISRSSQEEYHLQGGALPSDNISPVIYPYQMDWLQSYDHQL